MYIPLYNKYLSLYLKDNQIIKLISSNVWKQTKEYKILSESYNVLLSIAYIIVSCTEYIAFV